MKKAKVGQRIVIRRVWGNSSHSDWAGALEGLVGTVVKNNVENAPWIQPDELCARVLGVWDYLTRDGCPHRYGGFNKGDPVWGISILCDYDIIPKRRK